MRKQFKVFIGGLLYGLFGFIIFNASLAAFTTAIFGFTGTGLDSLGTIILIGKPLVLVAMAISAVLVIWIGKGFLRLLRLEAPQYYAFFGLIIVWSIAQVVDPFVPVYLEIGLSASLIGYLMNSLLLSLALTALFGGIAFVIIANMRSRTARPTIWLGGIAVGLVVIGSLLSTALAVDRDALYRQQSQKISRESDINRVGDLVYLPPKGSPWTQPIYVNVHESVTRTLQLDILPNTKTTAARDYDQIIYLFDTDIAIEENDYGACVKTGWPSLDRSDTCKIVYEDSSMKVYLESAVDDAPDPDYYKFFVQRGEALFYLGAAVHAAHKDKYIAHTLEFIRALKPASKERLLELNEAYQKQLPPRA